jgi:hypothetical protein
MEDTAMSATATATTSRIIAIEANINARHEPETGKIEFRLMNSNGDWILASSNWNADRHMTDEEIERYYADRRESIACDFNEALMMR